MASMFVLATASLVAPVPAGATATGKLDSVTTFAKVPEPGHSFAALPAGTVVYATTAAGNPTTVNTTGAERLLTYDRRGRLLYSKPVTVAAPNMGLDELARDAEGRLYVSDMNGRILRFRVSGGRPTDGEVYASVPPPYSLGGWYTSMWNGLAFDRDGNLYVADSQTAAVWRIPPNGEPEIYFRDVRLAGGPPGGPFGARIGPDGKLYITVLGSALPGNVNDGIVYRLRLSEHPSAADLETFHVFRVGSGRPDRPFPGPADVAFGRSGRVYVSLGFGDQLAVLSPDGKELRRISSPLFAQESGLSWFGRSLLVGNSDWAPGEETQGDKWTILRVWVGDRGVAPVTPSVGSSTPSPRSVLHSVGPVIAPPVCSTTSLLPSMGC